MKKAALVLMLAAGLFLLNTAPVKAETATAEVHKVTAEGIGEKIGTVTFTDAAKGGVDIMVDLMGLPEGQRGFHVHEKGMCEPAKDKEGKSVPALAAGGHYDPTNAGKHAGPEGQGHKGDLPFITADAKGIAKQTVHAPHLTVKDIKNRSVMVHAGGDNYSDDPKPLGGGGARFACGVIK